MTDFYSANLKDINLKKEGHLLWVSFNRPETRNAITCDMIDSLVTALEFADADQEVRVIILTGEGKSFCAGGDIKGMKDKTGMFAGEANELRIRYRNGIQRIPEAFARLSTPIIAMINGAAVGAGCDIVSMCDLRVASDDAKFAETFSKLGLVPGDGGTYYLQRAIGFSKAMEMYLTADMYSAEQALEMGLINKLVKKNDLQQATKELAQKISNNSPIAIQMTKRALVQAYRSDLASNLELLSSFQAITQRTHDHEDALLAFVEKRAPNFKSQ